MKSVYSAVRTGALNKAYLLRDAPTRAVNTFHLGYKNQSVYGVSGTSHCLFSDKYKTHKLQCGQNIQLLNVKPVGASRDQ